MYFYKATANSITFNDEVCTLNTAYDPILEIITLSDEDICELLATKTRLNLNNEGCMTLARLFRDYYTDKTIMLYDRMPKKLKDMMAVSRTKNKAIKNMNNEMLAEIFLKGIANDIAMDATMMKIDYTTADHTKKIIQLTDEQYEEIFSKIDEIREENPQIAENVIKVKEAFDKAKTFDTQLEYLKNDSLRNVKRYHQHYLGDLTWYNKWINQTTIPVPQLDPVMDILRSRFKTKYTTDEYKSFIVLLIRSVKDLQINLLPNIAYVHRLTDSILRFRFKYDSEKDAKVFNRIEEVLQEIRKKLQTKPK